MQRLVLTSTFPNEFYNVSYSASQVESEVL
jgi:hypothetical protein